MGTFNTKKKFADATDIFLTEILVKDSIGEITVLGSQLAKFCHYIILLT